MPPASLPPVQDSRECLLEAGLLCFAIHGFEGTSIRQVAERAGKNVSLVSHYFGNKEGLYRSVLQQAIASVARVPGRGKGRGIATPLERLRAFVRHALAGAPGAQRLEDPRKQAAQRILLFELHFPRPEVRDLVRGHFSSVSQELLEILQAVEPGLSPGELAEWAAMVQGCCRVLILAPAPNLPGGPALEALAGRWTELFHRGLTGLRTASTGSSCSNSPFRSHP